MAMKTTTVTEEAYRALKANKKQGESFSQTLIRICPKRQTVGALLEWYESGNRILTPEEAEKAEQGISDHRTRYDNETRERRNRNWKNSSHIGPQN